MKQKIELSKQEARLVVRALFALDDECKFTMADRINRKIRNAFDETDDWLVAIRLNDGCED